MMVEGSGAGESVMATAHSKPPAAETLSRVLIVDDDPGVLVLQDFRAEFGEQPRQLLVDLTGDHNRTVRRVEPIRECLLDRRMIDERERACDEDVIRLGSEPEVYAESILKTCQFFIESPLVCVAGVTGSDLKKRIEQIMTEERRAETVRARLRRQHLRSGRRWWPRPSRCCRWWRSSACW